MSRGGNITTRLDEPYAQQPETRVAATAYLERTGNADLLAVLGLAAEQPHPKIPAAPVASGLCPRGHKLPKHGVCRKSEACREAARERGIRA
ncbi:hypothetical protein ACTOB_001379 [Actinoplanes oblitus]|uniref:Uncharacterized protein n=1 Tax=Actinoplanes oblitus TaxID=3040509 RepID=A0ABY8WJ37_9ACTN|nr:hypothetical protein [Actinoplanes oblitus]WIM97825.1 hypothetical protein ACTOB_001379 [Actinoplanes oblitus]